MTPQEKLAYLKLRRQHFEEILRRETGEDINIQILVFDADELRAATYNDTESHWTHAITKEPACPYSALYLGVGHLTIFGRDEESKQ